MESVVFALPATMVTKRRADGVIKSQGGKGVVMKVMGEKEQEKWRSWGSRDQSGESWGEDGGEFSLTLPGKRTREVGIGSSVEKEKARKKKNVRARYKRLQCLVPKQQFQIRKLKARNESLEKEIGMAKGHTNDMRQVARVLAKVILNNCRESCLVEEHDAIYKVLELEKEFLEARKEVKVRKKKAPLKLRGVNDQLVQARMINASLKYRENLHYHEGKVKDMVDAIRDKTPEEKDVIIKGLIEEVHKVRREKINVQSQNKRLIGQVCTYSKLHSHSVTAQVGGEEVNQSDGLDQPLSLIHI